MRDSLLKYLAQQDASPELLQPSVQKPTASKVEASSPVQASDPGSSIYLPTIMFVALFVGMYFLVIRPQRKEEKQKKEMLSTLQKGDTVVTVSGIIGTVATIKDETVILKVGDGTRMEFLRSAVGEKRKASTESGS